MKVLLDNPIYSDSPYKIKSLNGEQLLPMCSNTIFKHLLEGQDGLKYVSLIISELLEVSYDKVYNSIKFDEKLSNKYSKRRLCYTFKIDDIDTYVEINNYSDASFFNYEYNYNIYNSILSKVSCANCGLSVIIINLNNFKIDNCDCETDLFMLENKTHNHVIENFKIYNVYIPNVRDKYLKKEELTRLDKFMFVGNEPEKVIVKSVLNDDSLLEKFYEKRCELSNSDYILNEYDSEVYEKNITLVNKLTIRKNAKVEIAKKLLLKDMSLEEISDITGLSMDEIEKLK